MLGPCPAGALTTTAGGRSPTCRSGRSAYCPLDTTYSIIAALVVLDDAVRTSPVASWMGFTASRPLAADLWFTSTASRCSSALILAAALTGTSPGVSWRQATSTQRERMAGGISSNLRVVAPAKRKLAGRPF